MAGDRGAVLAGHRIGSVARAVIDDEDRGRDPAHLGRQAIEDVADVVDLVVGRDQDRNPVAKALRLAGGAELLPGEPLERAAQLLREPRSLRERTQNQQEEDHDCEDRDADDAGPVLALEREGGEQRVGDLGPGDDRERQRDREEDEHVGVPQLAAACDRVAGDQRGEDQPARADRGQLGGK